MSWYFLPCSRITSGIMPSCSVAKPISASSVLRASPHLQGGGGGWGRRSELTVLLLFAARHEGTIEAGAWRAI